MNTPFSTVLIVFRETETSWASSACVKPASVRASRKRLPSAGSDNAFAGSFEEGEAGARRHGANTQDHRRGFGQRKIDEE